MHINLSLSKAAAALLAIASCFTSMTTTAAESDLRQTPKKFEFTRTITGSLEYLLYLPQGYDADTSKKWPLMLFLHGAGERGSDVSKVAVHGPPMLVKQGTNFPFILVSPQCPEGQRWSNEILLGLLDDVMSTLRVDKSRVYLTGLSMGGYGTWNLGCSYPEKFAAIAPICGGGEKIAVLLTTWEKAQALRSLPVWAFHGAKDDVVPLEESERMVNALKRAGVQGVKLTVYPEAGHNSWTETYNNPEFFEWMLSKSR